MQKVKFITAKKTAMVCLFTVIAFIISNIHITLPFSPDFYELDISSSVALIGSYVIGPLAGCIISIIKAVLNMLIFGSETAFVGEYVDIIITILYVFPASIIFRNHKNIKTAVIGMATGVILMTLCGCILNYYFLIPIYSKLVGISIDTIISSANNMLVTDLKSLVLLITLPFNIIKGTICSIIAFLCLIPLSKLQIKHEAKSMKHDA